MTDGARHGGTRIRTRLLAGVTAMTAIMVALGSIGFHYVDEVTRSVERTTERTSPLLAGVEQTSELVDHAGTWIRETLAQCSDTRTPWSPLTPLDRSDFARRLDDLRVLVHAVGLDGEAVALSIDGTALTEIAADVSTACLERDRLLREIVERRRQLTGTLTTLRLTTRLLTDRFEGEMTSDEERAKLLGSDAEPDADALRDLLTRTYDDVWPVLRALYMVDEVVGRIDTSTDRLGDDEGPEAIETIVEAQIRDVETLRELGRRLLPRLSALAGDDTIGSAKIVAQAIERTAALLRDPDGLHQLRRRYEESGAELPMRRIAHARASADLAALLRRLDAEARQLDREARERMTATIAESRAAVWIGIGSASLITLLLAFGFARALTGPLEALTRHAERLRDRPDQWDGLPAPLLARSDELGSLARSFDEMVNALAAARAELLEESRQQLRIEFDQLSTVFEALPLGLYLLDSDGHLLIANRRIAEMYGFSDPPPQTGQRIDELIARRIANGHGLVDGDNHRMMSRLAVGDHIEQSVETLVDGRVVVVTVAPTPDHGSVVIHEDITERRRAEARIEYLAHHDPLTGLPNRALFRQQICELLGTLEEGCHVALLFLDLDHFKSVNDTLGHQTGDRLLVAAAERLRLLVGRHDRIARLGGDEFAVIVGGDTRPEDAATIAAEIVDTLGRPFDIDEHHVVIGVSIGIAMAPTDADDADHLLKNADMALYRAKRDGRNTHRFFEAEMDRLMQRRRSLELDLRKALDAGEMEIFYQPVIGLDGDRVVGFEALLRWNHPQRGMVSPAEFVPLAEETGIIGAIGAWVLKRACCDAAAWPADVRVAVNISPVQFRGRALVLDVLAALAASGLRADRLELEITEGVLLAETHSTLETLGQLRDIGARIVMDDFGTGYSSLGYLRKFAFDKVKIDQSFVRDLDDRKDSLAIVRAVTGLCSSLGITTTAEGVETAEQLVRLRGEGCDQVQGYYFSRPRPIAEVARLLDRFSGEATAHARAAAG